MTEHDMNQIENIEDILHLLAAEFEITLPEGFVEKSMAAPGYSNFLRYGEKKVKGKVVAVKYEKTSADLMPRHDVNDDDYQEQLMQAKTPESVQVTVDGIGLKLQYVPYQDREGVFLYPVDKHASAAIRSLIGTQEFERAGSIANQLGLVHVAVTGNSHRKGDEDGNFVTRLSDVVMGGHMLINYTSQRLDN